MKKKLVQLLMLIIASYSLSALAVEYECSHVTLPGKTREVKISQKFLSSEVTKIDGIPIAEFKVSTNEFTRERDRVTVISHGTIRDEITTLESLLLDYDYNSQTINEFKNMNYRVWRNSSYLYIIDEDLISLKNSGKLVLLEYPTSRCPFTNENPEFLSMCQGRYQLLECSKN